jgi:hypothetical protein
MLSYRHAFHAGNHADVLKHCILVNLMRYLAQKDKPYWVIDTHAGAGAYGLDAGYASQERRTRSRHRPPLAAHRSAAGAGGLRRCGAGDQLRTAT